MIRALTIPQVLVAAAALLACESPGLERQLEFDEPISDLHVLLEAGDIELIGTDDPLIRVEVDVSYSGGTPPELETFVDDSLLRVWLSCYDGCWNLDGRVVVHAPRHVRGKLDTGRGGVRIESTTGEIAAETGAGSIRGIDLVSANLTAINERGPVVLSYASRPSAVEVDVERGNIEVELPAGVYDIEAHSYSGSVVLDAVTHDAESREELTLITRDGAVRVVGY